MFRQTLRDVTAHHGGVEPVESHARISREIGDRADQRRLRARFPAEAPAMFSLYQRDAASIGMNVCMRLTRLARSWRRRNIHRPQRVRWAIGACIRFVHRRSSAWRRGPLSCGSLGAKVLSDPIPRETTCIRFTQRTTSSSRLNGHRERDGRVQVLDLCTCHGILPEYGTPPVDRCARSAPREKRSAASHGRRSEVTRRSTRYRRCRSRRIETCLVSKAGGRHAARRLDAARSRTCYRRNDRGC